MRFLVVLFFILPLLYFENSAKAESPDCTVDPQSFQNSLALDFNDFDQNMIGGWRTIANKGCYLAAGTLVDSYHLQHLSEILDWQDRILYWHAGQLYAFQNIYPIAIARFEKSINLQELPSDPFKWNAYVEASIAFLKGDLEALKQKRDVLITATDPNSKNNLRIVDNFIQCFGKPYSQAYRTTNNCN